MPKPQEAAPLDPDTHTDTVRVLPGTTPLVAIALMEMAVSIVCGKENQVGTMQCPFCTGAEEQAVGGDVGSHQDMGLPRAVLGCLWQSWREVWREGWRAGRVWKDQKHSKELRIARLPRTLPVFSTPSFCPGVTVLDRCVTAAWQGQRTPPPLPSQTAASVCIICTVLLLIALGS